MARAFASIGTAGNGGNCTPGTGVRRRCPPKSIPTTCCCSTSIAPTTAVRSRRRRTRPHASGPRAGSSGCRTWCRPMRSSSESARAFWRGWSRVLLAPETILGVWLATALAALPAAILMHDAISTQLGSSLTASKVAAGFDYGWWEEFEAQARGVAKTLAPVVIGAAAPVSNWSSLMDVSGIPRSLLVPVAFALAVWLFLSGGLIDRFARGRRIGTRAFFGTCGLFFFRFLRLGLLIGAGYYVLTGWFHELLFNVLFPWITHEVTSERAAFAWRVALYVIWLLPLLAVNIVADYAKVRAVVEDRRSMLGALAAGARFVARHPVAAVGLYFTNTLVLAVCFSLY